MYDEDAIVGFIGIMHRPHPINKKLKGVSRLVILPDYQGIGLGSKFLEAIAAMYKKQGWEFVIRTSAKNLVLKLYHDPKWIMVLMRNNEKTKHRHNRKIQQSIADKMQNCRI